MRIISVINQKGGCGKTTTAINLSACLAAENRRVLLVDLDPQAHASLGLRVNPDTVAVGMYEVLTQGVPLDDVIIRDVWTGLDLAPASIVLSAAEQGLAREGDRDRRLLNQIAGLRKSYDYILIDCPPSLGLLTFNALRACGEAIVPVEPSLFSLHGIAKLMETVQLLQEKTQHQVRIKALATLFTRKTRFAWEVLREIENHFRGQFFKTPIRATVKLREAASHGVPITTYDRSSTGCEDYRALALEVLEEERRLLEKLSHLGNTVPGPSCLSDCVVFTIIEPSAADIRVAGDFNEWVPDKDVISSKSENGAWKKIMSTGPGTYQYRFFVDGKWREDPCNPSRAANEFGEYNSLVEVK